MACNDRLLQAGVPHSWLEQLTAWCSDAGTPGKGAWPPAMYGFEALSFNIKHGYLGEIGASALLCTCPMHHRAELIACFCRGHRSRAQGRPAQAV